MASPVRKPEQRHSSPAVAYDVTNRHANATTDIPFQKEADTPGMVEIIDPPKAYRAPRFLGGRACCRTAWMEDSLK